MSRNQTNGIFTAFLLLSMTVPTWSATVWVTSREDSGPGTLRQALADANNGDTIGFNLSDSIIIYSPFQCYAYSSFLTNKFLLF
jgi:hypothetical protein